ncbi:MAG: hypothetical protein COB16_14000 [Rhodobacteraceae bacterium]|nr:MAG: hypothetical protein COB16_14000 [Paracoccaceae bacterium]
MQHARAVIVVALAVFALPALSDVKGLGGKTIDCYCTDKSGSRVELGQTICLHVDGRMFMAQCQMSLNVPMWREVQQGCLSSSRDQRLANYSPIASPPPL